MGDYFVHETAIVEKGAVIGEGSKVWHFAHIRSGAKIGKNCTIAKCVYIDEGVVIGNRVKIQNSCDVYFGVTLEDDVFVGPNVAFTNIKYPRSDMKKSWKECISKTLIKQNASIGAGSTIVCGVTVGKNSLIGTGTLVNKDVPDNVVVYDERKKVIKPLE